MYIKCEFELKIKGTKEIIENVIKWLSKSKIKYIKEKETTQNLDKTFTTYLIGECNKSVFMCLNTELIIKSLGCEIEIFSENLCDEISEHIYCRCGRCIEYKTTSTCFAGYDKETGLITREINWDSYKDETIIVNPNRFEEGYNWEL